MVVVVVGQNRLAEALSRLLQAAGSTPRALAPQPTPEEAGAALDEVELVLLALPVSELRGALAALPLGPQHRVVVCERGPEPEGGLWPSRLVSTRTPALRVGVLAGPLLPAPVLRGEPAAAVVASAYDEVNRAVQGALHSPLCRVYTSADVSGVELAAAFVRPLTLALGVAAGMQMGAGVSGLLMSRGLAEARRLGAALKAQPDTFTGLAGLGDLVASAADAQDPAFAAGRALAAGQPAEDPALRIGEALLAQAQRFGVDLPLTEAVLRIGRRELSARAALGELMSREARERGE